MTPLLLAFTTFLSEPRVALAWDAPPKCPSEEEVVQRLAMEVQGEGDTLRVDAAVTADADGYRLRGTMSAGSRQQRLTLSHPRSCRALVDRLALHLAPLFLPPPDAPPARPRPPSGRYFRAAADLDAASLRRCDTSDCTTPMVAAGAMIAAGGARGRLRLEIGVPILTNLVTTASMNGILDARWILFGGQARACGAFTRRHVDLLLCGELGARTLLGRIHSLDPQFRAKTPYLTWGLARLVLAAVWWIHPHVGLRAEVTPGINLHGANFKVFYDALSTKPPLLAVGFLHLGAGLGIDVRWGHKGRGSR